MKALKRFIIFQILIWTSIITLSFYAITKYELNTFLIISNSLIITACSIGIFKLIEIYIDTNKM